MDLPPPSAPSQPTVSVVLTLLWPRGRAVESVMSWTMGQSLPRQRIELIVVENGSDPRLAQAVQAQLLAQDRLVRLRSANEMELYDHGARLARGEWLLFTEPHVIADPRCLAALLHHVAERSLDGAC